MRYMYQYDPGSSRHAFLLEWDEHDLIHLDLDGMDRRLLAECSHSDGIADKLLGLECLARRLEQ